MGRVRAGVHHANSSGYLRARSQAGFDAGILTEVAGEGGKELTGRAVGRPKRRRILASTSCKVTKAAPLWFPLFHRRSVGRGATDTDVQTYLDINFHRRITRVLPVRAQLLRNSWAPPRQWAYLAACHWPPWSREFVEVLCQQAEFTVEVEKRFKDRNATVVWSMSAGSKPTAKQARSLLQANDRTLRPKHPWIASFLWKTIIWEGRQLCS